MPYHPPHIKGDYLCSYSYQPGTLFEEMYVDIYLWINQDGNQEIHLKWQPSSIIYTNLQELMETGAEGRRAAIPHITKHTYLQPRHSTVSPE